MGSYLEPDDDKNLKDGVQLGDLGVGGGIIFKCILMVLEGVEWI
jgi:hypothetical protein